ncbi:MAG: hypothetical protein KA066_01260 [Candidatus Pacebacteria bacterium]|nr:hypothetical protein [Candidatus Paceibacterota bacterium]
MPQAAKPAAAGKRLCGICNKPLSMYNKDDICMSHKAEDIARYREKNQDQGRESRALLAFIKEAHTADTVKEVLDKAKNRKLSSAQRKAVTDLERYPESIALLRIASRVFRMSMTVILRKSSTSPKSKIVRDVLAYIMRKDLEMPPEDVATFFNYQYLPRVPEAVERITRAMLDDEDMILAVDLVREEFKYTAID